MHGKLSCQHVRGLSVAFQTGLLTADPNFELTWFQHPVSIFIGKGHLITCESKLDGFLFARRELNTIESLQLEQGHRQ